ncbi:MAG: nucleotidyltransferase domain-containing protein [Bacteroidetes bacterium]|nr:nucleotidyltransferase domain-containing protein [Bacteroidota bacterium]
MNILDDHIDSLKSLCERYAVDELYVFGSVLSDSFRKDSDLDFLVSFSDINPENYFDNYMDFRESLTKLFNRKIDLLEIQTLRNPILKQSIDRSKRKLYGRTDTKMAV